jgi:hypothetical protein
MKVHAVLAAIAVLLPGCAMSREAQLESVAKDWCLTVRASQVIPVYPLTEDLVPGDIFLVTVPVDKQHTIYTERGFLPLDYHIARIDPDGYEEFYDRSFSPTPPVLPKTWLNPGKEKWNWAGAPTAAFPSYSFSTTKGGGLSLALPVSGVPIGLSLLGARSATGSITISDARTYGIDAVSLIRQMDAFARDKGSS